MKDDKSDDLVNVLSGFSLIIGTLFLILPIALVLLVRSDVGGFKQVISRKYAIIGIFIGIIGSILAFLSQSNWIYLNQNLFVFGNLHVKAQNFVDLLCLNIFAVSIILFTFPLWSHFFEQKSDLRKNLF